MSKKDPIRIVTNEEMLAKFLDEGPQHCEEIEDFCDCNEAKEIDLLLNISVSGKIFDKMTDEDKEKCVKIIEHTHGEMVLLISQLLELANWPEIINEEGKSESLFNYITVE